MCTGRLIAKSFEWLFVDSSVELCYETGGERWDTAFIGYRIGYILMTAIPPRKGCALHHRELKKWWGITSSVPTFLVYRGRQLYASESLHLRPWTFRIWCDPPVELKGPCNCWFWT